MRLPFVAAAAAMLLASPAFAVDDACVGELEAEINAVLQQYGDQMPPDVEANWMQLGGLSAQAYADGDVALSCAYMAETRDYLVQQLQGGAVMEAAPDCLAPLQAEIDTLVEQVNGTMTPAVEAEWQRLGMEAADAAGAGDMPLACERASVLRDYLAQQL